MKFFVVMVVFVLLCMGICAQANVFSLGSELINLETVTVGDPGNPGQLSGISAGGSGPDRVCGAVDYIYKIGKYEVTAAQYVDFLNAKAASDSYGLYNANMWSNASGCKIQRTGTSGSYTYSVAADMANKPVNFVSFWDACRFANWLNNGQGTGDTETGAYDLHDYNGSVGSTILRNANANWYLASEDEWYKAAYYKGGGTNAGYWIYPTRSNSIPSNDLVSPDGGNNANFNQAGYTIGSPVYRTVVGEFENTPGPYGTFDQAGNVLEWNDTVVPNASIGFRSARGGSFFYGDAAFKAAYRNDYGNPTNENSYTGFRIAGAVDTIAPSIISVAPKISMVAAGDMVMVQVTASDNIAVASVTVNGINLTHTSGNLWEGSIPADPVLGVHMLTVVASDAALNTATDATSSYKTARVMGTSVHNLSDLVAKLSAPEYLFKTWGHATGVTSGEFMISDGSGANLRVVVSGHTILENDFVSVRGILTPNDTTVSILCDPANVWSFRN